MSKQPIKRKTSDVSLLSNNTRQQNGASAEIAPTTLLEALDRLSSHLPHALLRELVKQVVLEENEANVLDLLGKSVHVQHQNPHDDFDIQFDTRSMPGTKMKTKKDKKRPSRSQSLQNMMMLMNSSMSSQQVVNQNDFSPRMGLELDDSLSDSDASSLGGTHLGEQIGYALDLADYHDDEDEDDEDDLESLSDNSNGDRTHISSNRIDISKSVPEEEEDQGVNKLCQGRLSNMSVASDTNKSQSQQMIPDHFTVASQHTLGTKQSVTAHTVSGAQNKHAMPRLPSTHQSGALLFVDISGFTQLSRSLEVESLSKVINNYFQKIIEEINGLGGDIQKFAGDALLVTWTTNGTFTMEDAAYMAATCATRLVDECSDYTVPFQQSVKRSTINGDMQKPKQAVLNLHCALACGNIVGTHVGNHNRMEYVLLGDVLRQVSQAMKVAKLGEVVASPEAQRLLRKRLAFTADTTLDQPTVIAYKSQLLFKSKSQVEPANKTTKPQIPLSQQCQGWNDSMLDRLYNHMKPYVHPVVLDTAASVAATPDISTMTPTAVARRHSTHDAELRDVLTVFCQPILPNNVDLMHQDISEYVLDLLQQLMMIVQSEVGHFQGQLRQFIVDDKGLVIIFNFGLRGSTFPNMVEERAMPCISNVKTLLSTELSLDCRIGATAGKAYCGVVGGTSRGEYSVLGPSVNLAARLMAHADNPGVLVDRSLKVKAGSNPFKALDPVQAKGYSDPVRIYEPECSVRKSWVTISDEDFVGREAEVAELTFWAQRVVEDKESSKMVFITAPYGTGKSCLLSTAARKIEQMPGTLVCRHVFCEDDSFQPFSLVRPLFLDILRRKQNGNKPLSESTMKGLSSDLQKEALKQEEAQLRVLFLQACLSARVPMQYIEMFAGIIFTDKLSDLGKWSDKSQKMSEWNNIAKLLVQAYLHMTSSFDLVCLALDDISGMDEMSWKIVKLLYSDSDQFLIISAARNEYGLNVSKTVWDELKGQRHFSHMPLGQMEEFDMYKMACRKSGEGMFKFDQKVARTIYFLSEGNPFLASEILGNLYSKESGSTSDSASKTVRIQRVREILLNRLDSLSPAVRLHLHCGAILGLSFQLSDVVAVMEQYNSVPPDEKSQHQDLVRGSLEEAVEQGFLSTSDLPGGLRVYQFSHRLWRETISMHCLQEWKDSMQKLIDVIKMSELMNLPDTRREIVALKPLRTL